MNRERRAIALPDQSFGSNLTHLQLRVGDLADGVESLVAFFARLPKNFMVWVMLGDAFGPANLQDLAAKSSVLNMRFP